MKINIQNKNIVITGGSKGIGFEIAKRFSELNNVLICSRSKSNLNLAKKKIQNKFPKSNIFTFECDLLLEESLDSFIKHINILMPDVDILINNLGGGGRWGNKNFIKNKDINAQETMQKNYFYIEKLTRTILKSMVKNKWGRVINISSIYSSQVGGRPVFSSSKKAAETLMKCLSNDSYLAKKNITFNSILPGAIYTQSWRKNKNDLPKVKKAIPSGKLGNASDLSMLVYFLCSDASNHINGARITFDGGESQFI